MLLLSKKEVSFAACRVAYLHHHHNQQGGSKSGLLNVNNSNNGSRDNENDSGSMPTQARTSGVTAFHRPARSLLSARHGVSRDHFPAHSMSFPRETVPYHPADRLPIRDVAENHDVSEMEMPMVAQRSINDQLASVASKSRSNKKRTHSIRNPLIEDAIMFRLNESKSLHDNNTVVVVNPLRTSTFPERLSENGVKVTIALTGQSKTEDERHWKGFAKKREGKGSSVCCVDVTKMFHQLNESSRSNNKAIATHIFGEKENNFTIGHGGGEPGASIVITVPLTQQPLFLRVFYFSFLRHVIAGEYHSPFRYGGALQLHTFLSAAAYAQLLGKSRYKFISKPADIWSNLFKKTFEITPFNPNGFSIDDFIPIPKVAKKMAYQKAMQKTASQGDDDNPLMPNRFYGVTLSPRKFPIVGHSKVEPNHAEDLFAYHHWCMLVKGTPQKTKICDWIKQNLGTESFTERRSVQHLEGKTFKQAMGPFGEFPGELDELFEDVIRDRLRSFNGLNEPLTDEKMDNICQFEKNYREAYRRTFDSTNASLTHYADSVSDCTSSKSFKSTHYEQEETTDVHSLSDNNTNNEPSKSPHIAEEPSND